MYTTESISYAFRDDPTTIIALEDGGSRFKNVYQIATFSRRLINPGLIETPLYFCDNNGKYEGKATDIMNQIFDDNMSIKYDYAVVIDSQIEFETDYLVLEKLSKEYLPAQDIAAYQQYFSKYSSGVIILCRVYKINKAISPAYLQKGKLGSAQVIRLYDEFELETSVDADGFAPILSDNKFEYIKDEIIHLLKAENVFISLYQNNSPDNDKLNARLEAERVLKNVGVHRGGFDETLEMDAAQLDYDLIFNEVLSICPGMRDIIDNVRNIQAARYNEADYLLKQRNDPIKSGAAKRRLFDTQLRVAVKNALYFHKRYGIDIEDAFQEASIGLMISIDKYSENVHSAFGTYAGMWMRQIMHRYLPIYQYNVCIPAHYHEKIASIINSITSEFGYDWSSLSWNELLEWLQLCSDVDEEEAELICSILIRAVSMEELLSGTEPLFSDNGESIEIVDNEMFRKTVDSILDCLSPMDRRIIEMRYGYDGTEKTLNTIGEIYGITRERVRQREDRAIRKMRRYISSHKLFSGIFRDFTEEELRPTKYKK